MSSVGVLCPDGYVRSSSNDFIMDDEGARLIVESFTAHETDLPVDFEHQTLGGEFASPDGRAPAAGWITKLWREPGTGLQSLVHWNTDARGLIREGSYRYLSPVVLVRKEDRRAVALHSAALTNKPAIVGMTRVAASDRLAVNAEGDAGESAPADGGTDNLKQLVDKLRELLGVEGNVVAVLQAAIAALEKTAKGEDAGDADKEPVAGAVPPAGFVRQDEYDTLVAANRQHEDRQRDQDASELVTKYTVRKHENGMLVGVLNPDDPEAMTEALAFARRDPEGFEAVFSKLRIVYPTQGRTEPPERGAGERVQIIARARGEYRHDESLKKTTSEEAFVSLRLQERGLARLSEEEARQYDLVVG